MKVLLGLLLVLLLALQYRLWFGDGSLQEVWRLREQARASQAEVQRLSMRNQALAAEVADLKSGLEAIEERARAELGMIDKDETFYQFVLEQSVRSRPLASPDNQAESVDP
ncbi:cell division protein FtsB [Granulosicoccus sp. 3-233]|uniref:cell division protein FtsB n=1 Tax=Granulosicoccus sp. 3-233 TaxID=3417969 RepID=UPI003D3455EF